MSSLPHITSAVNGMKIPLLPGQAGIMHRFTNPENRLVISKTTESGRVDTDERMVIPATQENEAAAPSTTARRGKAKASPEPQTAVSKASVEPSAAAGMPAGVTL